MIELLLQLTHLGQELVVISIRVCHLFRDRIETVHHLDRLADAHLDILENGLRLIEVRFLQEDSDAIAR